MLDAAAAMLYAHDNSTESELSCLQMLAIALQSRVSEVLHVDIHPAAQLGSGVLIDHATGVVIGETAVVGNNVSMLHHVTLGGSGTGKGVRHPTIGGCEPSRYLQLLSCQECCAIQSAKLLVLQMRCSVLQVTGLC